MELIFNRLLAAVLTENFYTRVPTRIKEDSLLEKFGMRSRTRSDKTYFHFLPDKTRWKDNPQRAEFICSRPGKLFG